MTVLMMFRLAAAAAIVMSVAVYAAIDIEVDANGNVVTTPPPSPVAPAGQIGVTVHNKFIDKTLSIFWDAPGDNESEDVHMFDIQRLGMQGMNTFPGHHFYGKEKEDQKGDKLGTFIITPKSSVYAIGPDAEESSQMNIFAHLNKDRREAVVAASDGTVHISENSPVKIMGYRTTAMSAKFRCLTPYEVEYYYDDGKDGTYQGTLKLGKETTTNTYEGTRIVFYFAVVVCC